MNTRLGMGAVLAGCGVALAGCGGSINASDGPVPAGPLDNAAGTLVVRADTSQRDLVGGTAAALERQHPKVHVRLSYVSSAAGLGSADVVVSTDRQQLDRLHSEGAVGPSSVVARQALTLVVAPGNPGHVATLVDLKKPGVSVAVCATSEACGQAASTLLERSGVSPSDVRRVPDTEQGMSAVTAGRVDAALVWASDIRGASGRSNAQRGVREVSLAASPQKNIQLTGIATTPVLVATAPAGNRIAANAFVEELRSPQGQRLQRSDGYR